MTRCFISFLLLIAVALFGVLSPHAAMAAQSQTTWAPCHTEQPVMSEHVGAVEHCGPADHSMTGACATACLGSIAIWFPTPDQAPMAFRPVAHRAAISLILRGRMIETADRPPKSI